MKSAKSSATIACAESAKRYSGGPTRTPTMRPLGYLLQVTGLVVSLASLVFFGFRPEMGRMLYTALIGIALF